MNKEGKVRREGCICEASLDITTKWRDMRSKFRYTTLCEIGGNGLGLPYIKTFNNTKRLMQKGGL